MATYKPPCIHCGSMIEGDVRHCPACGSGSPFGLRCPACLREIFKGQKVCSGCGRSLTVTCPICRQQTFVDERCERCGAGLMIRCTNLRCGELQFFENIRCTSCGKKINKK